MNVLEVEIAEPAKKTSFHPASKPRNGRTYYLADELGAEYRTLMKYLPADQWVGWQSLKVKDLVRLLTAIASQVNVAGLTRTTRGPKKPRAQTRIYDNKHRHRSTARLLEEAENSS